MAVLRKYFLGEGLLPKEELVRILNEMQKILAELPNLAKVQEPVFVIGDIHGQYFDLIHMFEKAVDGVHDLNKTSLLFLGDFVDRGRFGVEVFAFLAALKINYPK
jgi:serine/threonine-protein phosphatase 2B catalytic subunit